MTTARDVGSLPGSRAYDQVQVVKNLTHGLIGSLKR